MKTFMISSDSIVSSNQTFLMIADNDEILEKHKSHLETFGQPKSFLGFSLYFSYKMV